MKRGLARKTSAPDAGRNGGRGPRAAQDQRPQSVYLFGLFGAICPQRGAGLVLPRGTTHAMQCHVQAVSAQVTPGAHAVVLLDRAGWHTSRKLVIPPNLTLLPLPPRSPELNPVENVWQFLRGNGLSNRVFKSYQEIVALSCEAWNKLTEQPWKIMSLGLRDWAHGF